MRPNSLECEINSRVFQELHILERDNFPVKVEEVYPGRILILNRESAYLIEDEESTLCEKTDLAYFLRISISTNHEEFCPAVALHELIEMEESASHHLQGEDLETYRRAINHAIERLEHQFPEWDIKYHLVDEMISIFPEICEVVEELGLVPGKEVTDSIATLKFLAVKGNK